MAKYYGGSGGGGGGAVTSVFSRSGAVIAQLADYSASQIAGGAYMSVADNTARDALPNTIRAIGLTAYVVATDKLYRLIGGTANANWVDVTVTTVSSSVSGIAPAITGANLVFKSDSGSAPVWGQIVDANVALGANISAAKTDGNFAAVNVLTQGFLSVGAATTVAASGTVRLPAGFTVKAFDNTVGTSTFNILVWGTGSINQLHVGDTANSQTVIDGGATAALATGGTLRLSASSAVISLLPVELSFSSAVSGPPLFRVSNSGSAGTVGDLSIRGQGPQAGATNINSSGVRVQGGRPTGTGLMGHVTLELNADDANFYTMVEAANVVGTARILSLLQRAALTSTQMPANTGDAVAFLANCVTAPTANAVGGGILYASAGALRWRGSAGTDTQIASA